MLHASNKDIVITLLQVVASQLQLVKVGSLIR